MRPSRDENAVGLLLDRAAAVQFDRPKQARHPRGECISASLRPGQRPTQVASLIPHAPIVTWAPSDWDRVELEEGATDVGRGQHTLHGGAILPKRVDLSVVESGSSMTTAQHRQCFNK